ncbi:hypothetical protein CRG98_006012 [Punica granatum]|uniref:Uncharacterized protein n=1 Tax=Punica granatum TaxID=22663 RepID=A0A2I0KYL8_PUNGR|nr:hypothetical protein CRG98_006012 [Punica granatum]
MASGDSFSHASVARLREDGHSQAALHRCAHVCPYEIKIRVRTSGNYLNQISSGQGDVLGSDRQKNQTFQLVVYFNLGQVYAGQACDPCLLAKLFSNRPNIHVHATCVPASFGSTSLGPAPYFGPRSVVLCQMYNRPSHTTLFYQDFGA